MIEDIEPAAWTSAPWGAAQGTTHEIMRWSDGSGRYVARISIATIDAPGPFTALPGYRRWLAVLDDGGGLDLEIGARHWRGTVGDTVAFDGADPVHATITRPARVWNLIVREHVPWTAHWHHTPSAFMKPSGAAVLHDVASGRTRVTTSMDAISVEVVTAPAIVVHLGLGC